VSPLCKDFIYLLQGRGSVGKRGAKPSLKSLPPLLWKERGIKGVRLISNLKLISFVIKLQTIYNLLTELVKG